MRYMINVGDKFGVFSVVERVKGGWSCICDICGHTSVQRGNNLHTRKNAYCGSSDCSRGALGYYKTHPREYNLWVEIRAKCNRPTHPLYSEYGGAGITVCQRWHEFHAFLRDCAACPSEDHTLALSPGQTEFGPATTEWIDKKELIRKSSRLLTYNGNTKPLAVWAREYKIPAETLWARLDRNWDVGRAITTPGRIKYESTDS